MPSFNQVILLGNLTRDPELKYLPNQTLIAQFGIATNRKWKGPNGEDKEEVCFVDCAAFARQAEIINEYCKKGKQVLVQGRLKYDSWEDKQGGGKRSKLTVTVEHIQLLGSRDDAPQQQSQRPAPASIGQGVRQKVAEKPAPQQPFGDEQQFQLEDIPF